MEEGEQSLRLSCRPSRRSSGHSAIVPTRNAVSRRSATSCIAGAFTGVKSESLLVELISDGFLREERFAHAFAGGKFRIKKWGRVRIEQALKGKQVSSPLIRQALAGIDDREYRKTLETLLRTRLAASKDSDPSSATAKPPTTPSAGAFRLELVWSILRDQE